MLCGSRIPMTSDRHGPWIRQPPLVYVNYIRQWHVRVDFLDLQTLVTKIRFYVYRCRPKHTRMWVIYVEITFRLPIRLCYVPSRCFFYKGWTTEANGSIDMAAEAVWLAWSIAVEPHCRHPVGDLQARQKDLPLPARLYRLIVWVSGHISIIPLVIRRNCPCLCRRPGYSECFLC